jgi:hypothetical protein
MKRHATHRIEVVDLIAKRRQQARKCTVQSMRAARLDDTERAEFNARSKGRLKKGTFTHIKD